MGGSYQTCILSPSPNNRVKMQIKKLKVKESMLTVSSVDVLYLFSPKTHFCVKSEKNSKTDISLNTVTFLSFPLIFCKTPEFFYHYPNNCNFYVEHLKLYVLCKNAIVRRFLNKFFRNTPEFYSKNKPIFLQFSYKLYNNR